MSRDYTYLKTKPTDIKFSLPYSDNSGERLIVILSPKQKDVLIKDGLDGDGILVSIEDIEWLRQVLDDVKQIIEMKGPSDPIER